MNLSKKHKIKTIQKSWEIRNILDTGKKIYFNYGIIFLGNKDESEKKIAILVKKNCGKAVRRNYIKRIARFYVRKNIALMEKFNRVIILFNSKNQFKYYHLEKDLDEKLHAFFN